MHISQAIRKYLGWCPHAHMAKAESGDSAGLSPGAANPVVKTPGPSAPDRSGKPRELRYEHTQPGLLMIGVLIAVIVLILVMTYLSGFEWVAGIVGIMVFVLAIMFMSALTVSLSDDDILRIRFGPLPLIRKSWPVAEIVSATPVTNPWYYGIGLRITPHGPLYNVSGRGAVEVRLQSGKTFRIGTDEPEVLCRAIEKVRTGRKRHGPALQ